MRLFPQFLSRGTQQQTRRPARSRARPFRPRLETLEDRAVPSTITWVNRGTASDNFGTVFGTNAALARSVVDAALDAWERLITDFRQNVSGSNPNNLDITLSMDPSSPGFGASAGSPASYDSNGHPLTRGITINSGTDTDGDGDGDGVGWFLDPTPNDHAEFAGPIFNAFVGQATPGGPADGLRDLFSIVTIEMNHAVGITNFQDSGSPRWRTNNPFLTNTGVTDTVDAPGTLFTFVSPSVSGLLTSNNGGPGGTDTGRALHVARPQVGTPVPGSAGARDVGNASFAPGSRYLPSLLSSVMLQNVYGYTLAAGGADVFGTMHTLLNSSNGNLLIRGGAGTSADDIAIRRDGNDLIVSVNVGNFVPGTGPARTMVSRFAPTLFSAITSITIQVGDGNDDVTLDFTGGNVIPPVASPTPAAPAPMRLTRLPTPTSTCATTSCRSSAPAWWR